MYSTFPLSKTKSVVSATTVAHTNMNHRFAHILSGLITLAALGACSDTTARSRPGEPTAPAITLPAASVPASDVSTVTTPAVSTSVPASSATNPQSTNPTTTTTNPTTTAPTTTAPTTTAPTTTTSPPPPVTDPPLPLQVSRGPIVVKMSDACFSAVWPIKISGYVENRTPLDPNAPPVRHDFEVSLQPQQNLDVIDDHREFRGFEGDIHGVLWLTVSHYEDPGLVDLRLSSMDGDLLNTFPLGPVDVVSDTCFLTVTWHQDAEQER
jgi:hypothetical protein